MKGWLIALAVLFLLAMVRVGVHVLYEEKQLQLELLISRFKLLLVGPKNEKKPKKSQSMVKPKSAKPETEPAQSKEKPKKKKGAAKPWIDAVLEYWRELFALIGRVLTTPTLDVLRVELQVGGDPEKCAMPYGRVCAMVGAVLPVVENTFRIRKRNIQVVPRFDRDDMEITAEAAITVRIYEIFALAFALLGLGVKILLQARNHKKAVQQYESSSS